MRRQEGKERDDGGTFIIVGGTLGHVATAAAAAAAFDPSIK